MTKYLPFYLDEHDFLTNQKAFIITGENIGTLVAFCNSTLFKFVYSDSFPELQGGTRELSKVFFEELFVKKSNHSEEKEYLDLVKELQIKTKLAKNTTSLLKEIDEKIFLSYGLSGTEIKAITDFFDL